MKSRGPIRISIRYQILFLVTTMVAITLFGFVYYAISLITEDKLAYVYDINSSLAFTKAEETRANIGSISDKMMYFGQQYASLMDSKDAEAVDNLARGLFLSDPSYVAIEIFGKQKGDYSRVYRVTNQSALVPLNLEQLDLDEAYKKHPVDPETVAGEKLVLTNISLPPDALLLSLAVYSDQSDMVILATMNTDRLLRIFSASKLYKVYMIDGYGKMIVHSEPERMFSHVSMNDHPFVKGAMDSSVNRAVREFEYSSEKKTETMIGAFAKLGIGRMIILTEISKTDALATAAVLKRRSLLFAIGMLFLSFFASIWFARRISNPLLQLKDFTKEVGEGSFGKKASIRSRSEVGELADSFNLMSLDLADRDSELNSARNAIESFSEELVYRISKVAEYRDEDTGNHIKRVSYYSQLLAKKLELDEPRVEAIRLASPLHDIGKVAIPDRLLLKKGKLTLEEFELMKEHAKIGHDMLDGTDSPVLAIARIIAQTHHEKFDGTGYPDGREGVAIPVEGRIVAVADVFDALMTERPYKMAFSIEKSRNIMLEGRGKHFDPIIIDIFFQNFEEILSIRDRYSDEQHALKIRESDRTHANLVEIQIGRERPLHKAFLRNISRSGLAISSKTLFDAGSKLKIRLSDLGEEFDIAGVVTWASEHPSDSMIHGDMGIDLFDQPPAFFDYYEKKIAALNNARQDPRYGKVIKVAYKSENELLSAYTKDISLGGLFIATKLLMPIGTQLEIHLLIKGSHNIVQANAVVVHMVDEEMSDKHGINPGIGVQFTGFLGDGEKVLKDYFFKLKKMESPVDME